MNAEPSPVPAGMVAASIPVDGARLIGGLYRAATGGNAPATMLLHGIPGHEKNLDLAADLRQRGFHVLYFHARGAWGSPGDYSIEALLPDARAALEWLRRRPEVDPARIAAVGFSLGGWVALSLAAEAGVAACVAVSPLIDPRDVPLPDDLAAEAAATLSGTSAAQLQQDWARLPSVIEFGARISRPALLITGDADSLFPPQHHQPLAGVLPDLRWIRFPRADHAFSDVRPGLRHVVCRWLRERL